MKQGVGMVGMLKVNQDCEQIRGEQSPSTDIVAVLTSIGNRAGGKQVSRQEPGRVRKVAQMVWVEWRQISVLSEGLLREI